METYDIMVIGGGTAGLRASLAASSAGKTTLLIEPGVLGGTCLNLGCIPTKIMLHASSLYAHSRHLKELGLNAKITVNFPKLMKRVADIVHEGQSHIKGSLKRQNFTLLRKKASFTGKNTVLVGGKEYSAKKILIATGAANAIPPLKGLDKVSYLTNESAIRLKKLPKSIIMIGGGYIAMEFATFFSQLGSKVTILEAAPTILGMLDGDVREALQEEYERSGVAIKVGVLINGVTQGQGKSGKKTVTFVENGLSKKVSADALLIATGRKPNTEGLCLEKTGVVMGKRGNIEVNDALQTSNPDIYAVGDVTGREMFAHAAKRETMIALHNMLEVNNQMQKMDFSLIPWAVFTHPTVSGVGLSEKQAKEKQLNYGVMKASFSKPGRAVIMQETEGFVKVLYEKSSRKLLGCVMVGPHTDDLIHEFVAVMHTSSPTIDIINETIHIHPTLSEVMDNFREG